MGCPVKFARIILANLFRKKVRLLLTLGSFAVALFLYSFLAVVRVAFTFGIDHTVAERLIVINRLSPFNTIPVSFKEKILRIPGVKYVTHDNWFPGIYQDGKKEFAEYVIDPEQQRQVYPELIVPEDQWQAFLKDRQGAIAGRAAAERFHWKIGDRIPIRATLYGGGTWEFNLVGVYHGKLNLDDEGQFWFRWDYFQEKLQQFDRGQVGWYVIRIENPDDAVRIAKTIDAEFRNSSSETRTQSESAFVADIVKQMGNVQVLILSIGALVFLTLLLVYGNTMAITVRERTSELGIYKALGFSDTLVLYLVMVESLTIALVGGVLGLLLAKVATPAISKALAGLLPNLILSPETLLVGLLLALLVGIASGLLPGIIAVRIRVVNALRNV